MFEELQRKTKKTEKKLNKNGKLERSCYFNTKTEKEISVASTRVKETASELN